MNQRERVIKELKELARDCRWQGDRDSALCASAYERSARIVEASALIDPRECAGRGMI